MYVPPNIRWDYVDSKATKMVSAPRRFYFHNVSSIQHASVLRFEDQFWDSTYDDMIEYYRFVASPKHRNYYYCGVAVLFTDGDLFLCVEIKCKKALLDVECMQFLRHQYHQVLNPNNKLYFAVYDKLDALIPITGKRNGKWCFTALPGYIRNSHHEYQFRFWKKWIYTYNLFLIRKQSVLIIWKTWKWYKKANLLRQVASYPN